MSASQFADEIGVQRSSVSHVMSGRNKPSLDFVTRIVNKYPEIDSVWLLTGKGEMLHEIYNGDKPHTIADNQDQLDNIETLSNDKGEENENKEKITENQPPVKVKSAKGIRATISKQVSRIVIFHPDGTFEEYLPGN